MATTIDPRMISELKILRINDARFAFLSAFQSQITFLSSINLQSVDLNVSNNFTTNQIFADDISNSGTISTNSFSSNFLTTDVLDANNITNADNITTANLDVTNDTTLTNLTATGNVVSNFAILTADNDYVFSDSDNSKVIHFDTTTTPEISAIFPNSLSEGFNVGLVNAGIGVIYLSGEDVINAPGSINSEIFTGVFVYKVNGNLFGIGSLE